MACTTLTTAAKVVWMWIAAHEVKCEACTVIARRGHGLAVGELPRVAVMATPLAQATVGETELHSTRVPVPSWRTRRTAHAVPLGHLDVIVHHDPIVARILADTDGHWRALGGRLHCTHSCVIAMRTRSGRRQSTRRAAHRQSRVG